jgi:hypothetical protein
MVSPEGELSATARPDPIEASVQVPPVRILMRNYFSTQLLWLAQHQSALAARLEAAHKGRSVFNMEHRAYVLAGIQAAVGFLEAMINELYQDAADGHGLTGEGYLAPLGHQAVMNMAEYWEETGGRRFVVSKYNRLLEIVGQDVLHKESDLRESAESLVLLRNAIAHYKSEDVVADIVHGLTHRLEGRFPNNRLMEGSGNPWWPDHCLGYGCAAWAWKTAKALADHVVDGLGISPNYRRHEEQGSFPQVVEPSL